MKRSVFPLVVMLAAAAFEVGGDALIRKGLRGAGPVLVALGFAVLGTYGIVVNLLDLDFSKLLGAYVGLFAVVSVCAGRFLFKDVVPASHLARPGGDRGRQPDHPRGLVGRPVAPSARGAATPRACDPDQ